MESNQPSNVTPSPTIPSSSSPSPVIFAENEKVLAFHKGMIYEAKINKMAFALDPPSKEPGSISTSTQEKWWHLLHYQGWNDRWDEWVDSTRLLKFNDENRELQSKMREEQKAKVLSKKKVVTATKDVPIPSGKKQKVDGSPQESSSPLSNKNKNKKKKPETTSSFSGMHSIPSHPSPSSPQTYSSTSLNSSTTFSSNAPSSQTSSSIHIELTLPITLKRKLIDDWENVVHERCLVPLPRKPNVVDIIDSYQKSRDSQMGSFDPVLSGLVAYFDKALGSILLYRFERQQYAWVLKEYPASPMSKLYGVEHLLRLFVKLPSLVPGQDMEDETRFRIEATIKDLIKYISKNISTFFVNEYEAAPPSYMRLSNIG